VKHQFPLAIALLLCCTAASAKEDYSWCQGYIVKALGEFPVAGLSRTSMWLDWNAIVNETVVNNSLDRQRYQAGKDEFERLHNAGNIQGIIDVSEEDCDVGRVPGWLWW